MSAFMFNSLTVNTRTLFYYIYYINPFPLLLAWPSRGVRGPVIEINGDRDNRALHIA
jgi:hypothetical protein